MKMKLVSCLLILLMGVPLMAAPPKGKSAPTSALAVDNITFINANKILMFVTNHGNFGRDLADYFGNDYGTYFPYTTEEAISSGEDTRSPYYAGGLWIGAVDSAAGDTLTTISEYSSEYAPGPMLGGTFMPDDPAFKVYKLYKDSVGDNANQDYLDWPVDQGAPVDGQGNPDMIGDQMCWSVFNDADPDMHTNMSTAPLGLEVKQLAFAFNREDPLGNVVFIRYRIYNKGAKILKDCFFSIWSDPDLGTAGDDLVGCDTLLDLGYTYNADNDDQYYGSTPPAIGIDFFQGPLVSTGDDADTAKMWDTIWPGYTNMGLYSFNKYINGTDPDDYSETYAYMKGLRAKATGFPPYTYDGNILRFMFSGDPVLGTGDLDIAPDDRRHMQTTGPLTFRPGDSTEILCALVVGQGGDRKSSISVLKYYDIFAQLAYDADFILPEPPANPVVTTAELDGELTLTWTDISEVDPGEYPFEGYTIYQGPTGAGPWTRIANYDVVNGEAQITDLVLDPLTGALETRAVKFGSDSGIRRYFVVDQDYLTGLPLYNLSTYYFRVEAYSYDPLALPKTITAANRVPIIIVPQQPIVDEEYNEEVGGLLGVAHPAGASQGVVSVEIIDPSILTGHEYSVTFHEGDPDTTITFHEDTTAITYDTLTDTCHIFHEGDSVWIALPCVDTIYTIEDPGWDTVVNIPIWWDLNDVTASTTLLVDQTNQSGDDDYQVVDGFLVRVSGPAADALFTGFQCVANADGPIDPPEAGAAPWEGFPVPTDVDEDGYPTDGQQVGEGLWMITTGSAGLGVDRGPYSEWISRTFRGDEISGTGRRAQLGAYDWEMRFTGSNDDLGTNGGYAWEGFASGEAYWVPFELWRIGISTPDDTSDDVRLIPWVIGDGGDSLYWMSSYGPQDGGPCGPGGCEHELSGGDNDPATDWVYWKIPADVTPGEAGYLVFEAAMIADPTNWPGAEAAVMDRTVLVNWNGDTTADASGGATVPSGYNQDLPEMGTVFRLNTAKPNATNDVFTFTPAAPSAVALGEAALANIKAVPNPFYLYGPFDPAIGNRQIYFSNLPETCTITIYNLAGDYINRVEKEDASTSTAYWNVQTENNLPVASGIYIYVVDAPGFGTKIGKMAVFVEDEVLLIY